MAMLDFGTVRYYNLVTDKQKTGYINASSAQHRQDFFMRVAQKALFPFKLFLKLALGREFLKMLELVSFTNLQADIGEEQKNGLPAL